MYINYKNRIFGLDVVRAIAILLVLISHSTLLLFPDDTNILLTIFRFFGALGVDIFFVLSGFLIGAILLKHINKESTRFKDLVYFWVRRWFKTLPNYFLVLILNILIYYAFNADLILGLHRFFFFFHNFSQPMPDFFTESWSLSIEEFAYIIVPVLFYVALLFYKGKYKNRIFIGVTLFIIVLVFIARLFFYFNCSIDSYKDWSHQIRKVVIYRLDSIYFGFVAAYVAAVFSKLWYNYKITAFILGGLIFTVTHGVIFALNIEPQEASLFFIVFYLPLLSISLVLLFPMFSTWKTGGVLKKSITFISLISYALYLLNYSLILLVLEKFVDVEAFSWIGKSILLFTYWGLSFILSYFLYKYFEKPIMDLRDSQFIRKHFAE